MRKLELINALDSLGSIDNQIKLLYPDMECADTPAKTAIPSHEYNNLLRHLIMMSLPMPSQQLH